MVDGFEAPPGTFTPQELHLIEANPETLTATERAYRAMLWTKPLRFPFEPGKPMIADALFLQARGVKGGVEALVRILRQVEAGVVDFTPYGGWWQFLRGGMDVLLAHIRDTELALPGRKEYTFAEIMWRTVGGVSISVWSGIGPRDVDLAAARLVEIRVPELYDEVPASVRARLPSFGQPTVIINPPSEVPPPTPVIVPPPYPPGPTAAEIGQAVREAIPVDQLAGAIERAVIEGIRKSGPVAAPPPVAVPPPPPPPSAEVAVQPAPLAPGTSFAPKTSAQVTLMGEKVVRPTAPAVPSLAGQLEDKYRPVFLDQVLGNPDNVAILRGAAQTGHFQKLYLITGPPGIGKTTAVIAAIREYLQYVGASANESYFTLPFSPESPTFGITPSVLLYKNALDLIKLGGPTALIGALSKFTKTVPPPGLRSFVVVDDVTKFDKYAQQSLLPLTERYPRVTFFFLANDADYIDALVSRARTLRWRRPEREEVEARLVEIIVAEGFPFPDPVAEARKVVSSLGMTPEFRQAIIRLASDVTTLRGEL